MIIHAVQVYFRWYFFTFSCMTIYHTWDPFWSVICDIYGIIKLMYNELFYDQMGSTVPSYTIVHWSREEIPTEPYLVSAFFSYKYFQIEKMIWNIIEK